MVISKRFKKAVKWFSITLLGIIVLPFLFVFIFQDSIKKKAIDAISKELVSKVVIRDGVDISLFQDFPYVSINLKDITIYEAFNGKRGYNSFIKASRIGIGFNVFTLFKTNYQFNKIWIQKGSINVRINNAGFGNYDILKKSKQEKSSKFKFSIENIALKNCYVSYSNKQNTVDVNMFVEKSNLKGDFSDDEFALKCHLFANDINYNTDNKALLSHRKSEINCKININQITKTASIEKVKMDLNGEQILFEGIFDWSGDKTLSNFTASSDKMQLQGILPLTPSFIEEKLIKYNPSGNVSLMFSYKGDFTEKNQEIALNLATTDLKLSDKEHNLDANTSFTLNFTHKNGLNLISVKAFELKTTESDFKGELSASGYDTFTGDMKVAGGLKSGFISLFLPDIGINSESGSLLLNLSTDGKVNFSDYVELLNHLKGDIKTTDFGFKLPAANCSHINSDFSVSSGRADIQYLNFNLDESAISISGNIQDLFSFYTHKSKPVVDLVIKMPSYSYKSVESSNPESQSSGFEFTGNVSLTAQKISYNNIVLQNVNTDLKLSENELQVLIHKSEIFGGSISGKIELDLRSRMLKTKVDFSSINVKKAFVGFNDFGQDFIKAKHIDGHLSGKSSVTVPFNSKGDAILDEILAEIDFAILNGALTGFEPLNGLSKYVAIEDLQNIRFSKLSNLITINQGRIIVPQMVVLTNAAKFQIAGEHFTSNKYKYYLRLGLANILMSKSKKRALVEANSEPQADGGVTLNLIIEGNGGDFKIAFDNIQGRKETIEAFSKSAKDIGSILKNELQSKRVETSADPRESIAPIEETAPVKADSLVIKKPKKETAFDRIKNKLLEK